MRKHTYMCSYAVSASFVSRGTNIDALKSTVLKVYFAHTDTGRLVHHNAVKLPHLTRFSLSFHNPNILNTLIMLTTLTSLTLLTTLTTLMYRRCCSAWTLARICVLLHKAQYVVSFSSPSLSCHHSLHASPRFSLMLRMPMYCAVWSKSSRTGLSCLPICCRADILQCN
jgi:hypothetical protein